MLICNLVVWKYDLIEKYLPYFKCFLCPFCFNVFRKFFPVNIVKAGDDRPQKLTGLTPYIAFSVGQKLIQKIQRHQFFLLCHIRMILGKNIEICSLALPLPLTSCRLYQTAKCCLIIEDAHYPDIMSDCHMLEAFNNFFSHQQ